MFYCDNGRVPLRMRRQVHAVEVGAKRVAAKVAARNAVGVDHGHHEEDKPVLASVWRHASMRHALPIEAVLVSAHEGDVGGERYLLRTSLA